jgi:hypothetical protein
MDVDLIDLLIGVVLGAIVGGIIGWGISYYFYKMREMPDTLLLRALENAGFVEFNRNDMDEMIGTIRHGAIHSFVEGTVKAKGIDITGHHHQ